MVRFVSVAMNFPRPASRQGAEDVFRDVTFDLPDGSFRWLLGATGTGKTTLLRLINMSLRPTQGDIYVLGKPSTELRRSIMPNIRRQIGVVFPDCQLLPHLSAFDNVALPLRLGRRPEDQVHADVIEILRWMGLISKAAAVPALLSGGDVQKVMIARAVIGRPRLLLADQPTAGLDFYQSERIIHLLRELNRLGSTVLIATNDVSQAERHPGPTLLLAHNSLIEID